LGILAGFKATLEIFRLKGSSSLVLDYRGVGASPGELDPDKLSTDALAMWDEALRLVEGDSNRIVIRAASLGSLAAAAILQSGAKPKAIVVAAPLDSKTLASKAAADEFGDFLGGIAAVFLNQPSIPCLGDALASVTAPTLIISATEDLYCNSKEVTKILENAKDNVTHVEASVVHETLVTRFWGFALEANVGKAATDLIPAERAFFIKHVWNDLDQTSTTPAFPIK
jgi:alpha-beta hydrolase superfamily lysophospholipase